MGVDDTLGPYSSASGQKGVDTALALMRMALALLDQAGELTAAARLQHAIDTVGTERVPPFRV